MTEATHALPIGPQATLLHGDCLEVMRGMDAESVDAIVTDPPYGLKFMGKRWDHGVPSAEVWREALRVLKPGGHMLAFGGTRTYHRLVCAIEDAGFEIRDMIAWVYGSGFPKSLDVSKAIDKKVNELPVFDAIRAHIREWRDQKGYDNKALNEAAGSSTSGCGMARHWTSEEGGQHAIPSKEQWRKLKELLGWPDCEFDAIYDAVKDGAERPVIGRGTSDALAFYAERPPVGGYDITAPATEAARQWQGWGTALKPAHEPIVLARRPLSGTVAANILAHGTGGLNIDGCRVPGALEGDPMRFAKTDGGEFVARFDAAPVVRTEGRWPANLIHDGSDEATAVFPKDAARFFYCAKASKADREDGLAHREAIHRPNGNKWTDQDYRVTSGERPPSAESGPRRNHHPTVKPTELMRYLCRLITPPGGTVLDPFMGSGSTGRGSIMEGFGFIGIEIDPDYLAISEARIKAAGAVV